MKRHLFWACTGSSV